jgi:hypothetical protein
MRKYLNIKLADSPHGTTESHGEDIARAGCCLIPGGVNNACSAELDLAVIGQTGVDTLRMENQFNKTAGFAEKDGEQSNYFRD